MFTYLAGFPLTLPLVELTATEWVQANETPVEKNSYRVRGLPVGEKMLFRVTAVNIAGRSPPAVLPLLSDCSGIVLLHVLTKRIKLQQS